MTKGFFKKTAACFMAMVMLLSMAGCGKETKKQEKENKATKKDTRDMVYEGEEFLIDGVEGDILDLFVKGDRLYLDTIVYPDLKEASEESAEETDVIKYYSVNLDGSDLKTITLTNLDENDYVVNRTADEDGNILFLTLRYDSKTKKPVCHILKYDADGNEIYNKDISKILADHVRGVGIHQMTTDKNGNIVLLAVNANISAELCILDENADYMDTLKSDNCIEAVARTKDGNIIGYYRKEGESFVQDADIENKKWGKAYKIDITALDSSDCLMDGIAYDFYYKTNTGIFGYDLKKEQATEVMNFTASYLTFDGVRNIKPASEKQFIGTYFDPADGTKLFLYNKVDPSTIKEKQTITLGGVSVNEDLKNAAIKFNKTNPDYQIEIIDYSDIEDAEAKMNAEIAAGNIPDILDVSSGGTNEIYAAKGILEDLIPYIEKDKELSTEDFLPTAFEAMKTDDKLYSVSPSFLISTIIGKSSDVGTNIGWTFEDMMTVIEKNKNAKPFRADYKMYMLSDFQHTFNDFINWQTGECSFNSQYFKDILEFCNTGKSEETEDNEIDYHAYQRGEILFQTDIIHIEYLSEFEQMYKEEITYIGYPNKDKSGSYFEFPLQVGISSKSEVKEGAWEFVRSIMSMEYQSSLDKSLKVHIPVRKDSYEMLVKAMMTTEEYIDEIGQQVYPLGHEFDRIIYSDDFEVEIKPASQKDIDKFNELIEHTHKRVIWNYKVMEIIEEEVKPYFAGEKDVDETAKIIQSRVETYVNECR